MLSKSLEREIRSLWDAFWSGGIANPLTAIEQITYLIFLKRLEIMDDEEAKRASDENKAHSSIFDGKFVDHQKSSFRWSNILQMESEARLRHMQIVFDWLKTLPGAEERLRDAVFIIPSARLLQTAVTIIDKLFVPSQNYDTLGDIYEYLLSEIAESGKNGQFRTPRHIIRAMIDMVDPKLGDRICDPACGTGGFLVNSYLHILKENTSEDILRFEADGTPTFVYGDKLTPEQHESLRENHFYGYDFDRTMVRLAWMNMIQHGMKDPKMSYSDTLGSRFNEGIISGDVGEFDVILANPPFTGSIDSNDIGESLQSVGTTKTELLFLELILQLLKIGGRAAVIVPEGLLFGSTRAHIGLRQKLVEENQLNAVISLPQGVFQPYTGVKTSILVFNKGGHTDEVLFYEMRTDGFSLDAKRDPKPEQSDLWDAVLKYRLRFGLDAPSFCNDETWHVWKEVPEDQLGDLFLDPVLGIETLSLGDTEIEALMLQGFNNPEIRDEPCSWMATAMEIAENDFNLSAGRYKPFGLDIEDYAPPEQLIREIQEIEKDISSGLQDLLNMIGGEA